MTLRAQSRIPGAFVLLYSDLFVVTRVVKITQKLMSKNCFFGKVIIINSNLNSFKSCCRLRFA